MNKLTFTLRAWDEYVTWQTEDKKTLRKINALLKDITRNAFDGIGNPEPLIGDKSGMWSRRIDGKNRIVYRVNNKYIEIVQCKGHYDDH